MKTIIKYWEIEKRYQAKGDSNDREFCKHAGINYNSYRSRKAKNEKMNLLVALLIAGYLNCNITDFAQLK
jgi:hypothetical protein